MGVPYEPYDVIHSKRPLQTSDSYELADDLILDSSNGITNSQRIHEFTSDGLDSEYLQQLASSPPPDSHPAKRWCFNGALTPQRAHVPSSEMTDADDVDASQQTFTNTQATLVANAHASGTFGAFGPVGGPARTPLQVIERAIELGKPLIVLNGYNMHELPQEVADLKSLVDATPHKNMDPAITLDVSDNRLTRLPRELFEVVNIRTLYLGANCLEELPCAIGQLKNLEELSLGNNRLTALPSQILQLERLRRLSLYPNRFLPCPHELSSNAEPGICYYSEVSLNERAASRPAGSGRLLSDLCSEVIAKNVLPSEVAKWRMSDIQKRLVNLALKARADSKLCGVCGAYMVSGIGWVTEWWTEVCHNSDVPILRHICSQKCASRIEEMRMKASAVQAQLRERDALAMQRE